MPHHWNRKTAIAQIEACEFECEAGPITNNTAWMWIKNASEPNFFVGQKVWYCAEGELNGHKIKQWMPYTVLVCRLSSDTVRQTFVYDLTTDPPQPWHYGAGAQLSSVPENKIYAANPDTDVRAAIEGVR